MKLNPVKFSSPGGFVERLAAVDLKGNFIRSRPTTPTSVQSSNGDEEEGGE